MRKLTLILCVLMLFATGCEKKSETDSSEQIPAPIVTPIINEEPKDDEIIKEDILNEDLKEEQQEEIFWF